MPSSSKKQRNFMAAVAHSPAFAKKVGVPQSVGKDFNQADKGRKFSKGGDMAESKKAMEMRHAKTLGKIAKEEAKEAKGYAKGGSVGASKMGAVRTAAPSRDGIAERGKTRGKNIAMCGGGMARKK